MGLKRRQFLQALLAGAGCCLRSRRHQSSTVTSNPPRTRAEGPMARQRRPDGTRHLPTVSIRRGATASPYRS